MSVLIEIYNCTIPAKFYTLQTCKQAMCLQA
ncbi:hypothetical protein [Pseudomonas phage vB_Pa-PAC2]